MCYCTGVQWVFISDIDDVNYNGGPPTYPQTLYFETLGLDFHLFILVTLCFPQRNIFVQDSNVLT